MYRPTTVPATKIGHDAEDVYGFHFQLPLS
jgi:hypothetical protein